MELRTIHLSQAYCTLRWVLHRSGTLHLPRQTFLVSRDLLERLGNELRAVLQNLGGLPAVTFNIAAIQTTKWALQVIPSRNSLYTEQYQLLHFLQQLDPIPTLDVESFADYLFCINSFLTTVSPCDMA